MPEHAPRPVFARIYTKVARMSERRGGAEHRRKLLAGLSGRVIEIGAGSGANSFHYQAPAAARTPSTTQPPLTRQSLWSRSIIYAHARNRQPRTRPSRYPWSMESVIKWLIYAVLTRRTELHGGSRIKDNKRKNRGVLSSALSECHVRTGHI